MGNQSIASLNIFLRFLIFLQYYLQQMRLYYCEECCVNQIFFMKEKIIYKDAETYCALHGTLWYL